MDYLNEIERLKLQEDKRTEYLTKYFNFCSGRSFIGGLLTGTDSFLFRFYSARATLKNIGLTSEEMKTLNYFATKDFKNPDECFNMLKTLDISKSRTELQTLNTFLDIMKKSLSEEQI